MNQVYGYTRVSTVKQGTQGVSLQEQKSAIERYAQLHGLSINQWFVEQQTAAKRGRPMFTQMLRLLKIGKASGVIIHKIDRSARNLKDWADLGELIDAGTTVHVASEGLDLHSRGGRLSADIQAVIAADYIRNLREETRKGFYGRLKQGIYPLPAPVGYIDKGKGIPKAIDPVKGPLIKRAFQLYGTGTHSLYTLAQEMNRLGLINRNGKPITRTGYSTMLNNPFYTGIIRLRRTGEVFEGKHEPIITKKIFNQVKRVLEGKVSHRTQKHAFLFRRLLKCIVCQRSLIGEKQKGHVYYRCHSMQCKKTSLREETFSVLLAEMFDHITLTKSELESLKLKATEQEKTAQTETKKILQSLKIRIQQTEARKHRLTEAYIDQVIDKEQYIQSNETLLNKQQELKSSLRTMLDETTSVSNVMEEIVELLTRAKDNYYLGNDYEKREMIDTVLSNCVVQGKKPLLELCSPYKQLVNRRAVLNCAPQRTQPRTFNKGSVTDLYNILYKHCIAELDQRKEGHIP